MRIDLVHPNDLSKVWGPVSHGIWEIIELCNERFRPEDVYHNIKRGSAFLFVFQPTGFCVLEIITDPNNGERYLNAWLLWFKNELEEHRRPICDFLDDQARRNNCRSIRFGSPRGWGKFLRGEFREKMVIYEREVK